MDFSEIMNIILSGGLVGTAAAIGSLRATVRKAKAEAMKAEATERGVRVDNAEDGVLVSNIVVPLKEELNATRKDLQANKREMARLRKAIDTANSCRHHDDCPVLGGLRKQQEEHDGGEDTDGIGKHRQRERKPTGGTGDGGIPASSVKLSIPADSLRKLPEGAVYRGKSGQANLTVGSDDSGTSWPKLAPVCSSWCYGMKKSWRASVAKPIVPNFK